MNLAKAFSGAHPSTQGMIPSWESEEGVHTPSGSKTPIVMCGWLYKMKREHRKFRSTWNRRWFTVEDGAFRWYKTPSSEQGGRMSLVNITHVRRFEGGGHGNFTFIVQGTDRDMLLRADSANDVRRWTRGLTLQIDLVRGGTFQGPPSAKNRRRTVLRSAGDNDAGVLGRIGATGGLESGCGRGGPLGSMQLEHRHFQQINDCIHAFMDGHLESNSRRGQAFVAGREGNSPPDLDVHNTSPRHEGRESGADDGAGTPTSVSVVQTFQPTPRGGHAGDGAGDSSPEQSPRYDGDNGKVLRRWPPAKVVPFSSPPPSDAEEEEGRSDSGLRRHGESPGGETKDRVRAPIVDRISKPPPPKVPPPSNGGVRRGSGVPSLRSTDSRQTAGEKGEDSSGGMGSGGKRGVMSRTYDEASSTDGSFDDHGGIQDQHSGRGGSAGRIEGRVAYRRTISEGIGRRKSSSRGYDSTSGNDRSRGSPHFENFEHGSRDAFIYVGQGGRRELHAGSESGDERAFVHRLKKRGVGRRRRDRQRGGLEDPVDFSSDESTQTREGIFIDEYFAGDNARSSTSSAGVIYEKDAPIGRKSGGKSVDKVRDTQSPRPTKNAEGGRSAPSEADSAAVSRHRNSPQGTRWRTSRSTTVGVKSVALRNAPADDASGDECEDSRERFPHGLPGRTSGGNNGGGSTNGGNRWTASGMNSSLDKAFLRWSAGAEVSNRGLTSCGYPRASSSGSITAEESWSSGLGRGAEEDTSSRVGSGRLPSSRQSSSRQSSSARPARRYLMEQNRLRQGW